MLHVSIIVGVRDATQAVAGITKGGQGADRVGITLPEGDQALKARSQRAVGQARSVPVTQETAQGAQHRQTRRVFVVQLAPDLPKDAHLLPVGAKDVRAVQLEAIVR